MTELPASQSIELVPDILETDDDLRRAVRPLTVDLMSSAPDVDNARSIYELLCRVNPEFVRADWRNEPVQAIMRQAKAVGVISAGANDSYSWWLREAWERADEESRRTAPICDLVAAVVAENQFLLRGASVDQVVHDMQVIWGIRQGVTFDSQDAQAAEETAWTRNNPTAPPRVTPELRAGYNAFFKQNLDPGTPEDTW